MFLLSGYLKLQNSVLQGRSSVFKMPGIKYCRSMCQYECSGLAAHRFKCPGVTAHPILFCPINLGESAFSLFTSERRLKLTVKYTLSIHGLLLVLICANYILGNHTRKHGTARAIFSKTDKITLCSFTGTAATPFCCIYR